MSDRMDKTRRIKAPTGNKLTARSWLTEAPLRMLMNNLDAEVAEHPEALIVYGGIGRAARNWACYDKIVETLKRLDSDETLLIQSGKPVGVFKTHVDAPRVPTGWPINWAQRGSAGPRALQNSPALRLLQQRYHFRVAAQARMV